MSPSASHKKAAFLKDVFLEPIPSSQSFATITWIVAIWANVQQDRWISKNKYYYVTNKAF
jgi:hypothetical protein